MNKELKEKIRAYKKKFYINLLIKGGMISLGIIVCAFLLFSFLEYSFRFGEAVRAVLFFAFIAISLFLIIKYLIDPLSRMFILRRQLTNEQAAKDIGGHFPTISDKLLNILQLEKQANENELAKAGINQKAKEIEKTSFTQAVSFKVNIKYLKFILPVITIALIMILAAPDFRESSTRIIQYNKEFVPHAPFNFVLQNNELLAFKNEDFTIDLQLNGKFLPENVYLVNNGRRIKLNSNGDNYHHTFPKIQHDELFSFEAAGFTSQPYRVSVVQRPNIKNFNIQVIYPQYLKRERESLPNSGNLEIPEGSTVMWRFNTLESDAVAMRFEEENKEYELEPNGPQLFEFEKLFLNSDNYEIKLRNKFSANKDRFSYHIEVIPDQYPTIDMEQMQDTVLYNYIVLGGNVSDDYGLTELRLFYKKTGIDSKDSAYQAIILPIDRSKNSQSYYYQWFLDSLNLNSGEHIEYYVQVKDNDGVNGPKSSKTALHTFKAPDKKELRDEFERSSAKSRDEMDKNIQQAKDLNKDIEKSIDRLKGKKEMNWQDEKMIRELIEKKADLEKDIKDLQLQFEQNMEKKERFNENQSKSIKEKVEQLQKLMDELLDEETKKLYEELQKLLEENKDPNDLREQLEKLRNSENNLEKDLERTLELFKQMKFELKLDEIIEESKELSQEQEELSEKTMDKESEIENIKEEQEQLNQEQEELERSMDELDEMNRDLNNPRPVQDFSEEKQNLQMEREKTNDALEKGKRNKAQESQKNMSQQMQQMSQKMQQMQMNQQMTMMQENLDHLRDIQDNLIKLSFSQEDLMHDFSSINQSDPRFVDLSQRQLKLKEDAKIIEDSLRSLAERVFQIRSFVTREVDQMNDYIDESLKSLQDRKKNEAVGKQQFAMTSMNNLALLLDDVLQQMQNQMMDASGMPNKSNQKNGPEMPNLSELQRQLGEKIQELKKSGKTGRQLSEELAKLAAEQEMIRHALQEQQEKIEQKGNQGNDGMNDAMEKMEETELDLVNKTLTQKTIERQKEILTRLLEAEEALRERELDENREGEKAKNHERQIPPAFEEYIKLKKQEIEALKTVPPKINPYYKKEINEYFKRLKAQNIGN